MKITGAWPFHTENSGEVVNTGETGFQPLSISFWELGKRTASNVPDGVVHDASVDAIPSVIAHIQKFKSALIQTDSGNGVRYYEEEWRVVIAAYVLSKYRFLPLKEKRIEKNDCTPAVWEVFGKELTEALHTENSICFLMYKDQPIAVFDRDAFLIPIREKAVFESKGLQELSELCGYEENLLYTWLLPLKEEQLLLANYAARYADNLEKKGAQRDSFANMKESEFVCVGHMGYPGTVEQSLKRIPELLEEIPYPFLDRICLTRAYVETRQGKLVSEGIGRQQVITFQVKEENGEISYFSAVLPLSVELAEKLNEKGTVSLQSIDIDACDFVRKKLLYVSMKLKVGEISLQCRREYGEADISYISKMPVIMAYPYVDVPEKMWKDYNIVVLNPDGREVRDLSIPDSVADMLRYDGKEIDLYDSSMRQWDGAREEKREFVWYYGKYQQLPELLCLSVVESGQSNSSRNEDAGKHYIGCICVGKPEKKVERLDATKLAYFAIDLGTSNTITAMKEKDIGERIDYQLHRSDYLMPLVKDANSNRMIQFQNRLYVPSYNCEGKYPTMCSLYGIIPNEIRAKSYEDGCAIFPKQDETEELLRDVNDLMDKGIYSELKLGESQGRNRIALKLYIRNLVYLGCLRTVLKGIAQVKILMSFPRIEIKKRIMELMSSVLKEMKDIANDLTIEIAYMLEAEADRYFLGHEFEMFPEKNVGKQSVYSIIDIGDGTSDFNLFIRPKGMAKAKHLQCSVKYAGRDLTVKSIITNYANSEKFRDIWNIKTENDLNSINLSVQEKQKENKKRGNALNLVGKFWQCETELAERRKDISKAGEYGIELTMQKIVVMLLENIGLKEDLREEYLDIHRNFITLLKFKYLNLLRLCGEMMKGFQALEDSDSFKLYLYGGGKNGIKYITGLPLGDMETATFIEEVNRVFMESGSLQRVKMQIIADDSQMKNEVVSGMLWGQNILDSQKAKIEHDDQNEGTDVEYYSDRKSLEALYLSVSGDNERIFEGNWDESKKTRLEQLYTEYIEVFRNSKEFVLETESKASFFTLLSIDNKDKLVEKNREQFDRVVQRIWEDVCQDEENPELLLRPLFCMKMSESILLSHL